MAEIIYKFILYLLSSVGILAILITIINYLLSKKTGIVSKAAVLLILNGKNENIEHLVRKLIDATSDIKTENGKPEIYIVDKEKDKETSNICALLERDYPIIHKGTKEQIIYDFYDKFFGNL